MIRLTLVTVLALLAGCTMMARHALNERYGEPDSGRFDVAMKPPQGMSYRKDIQPILNRRCVVCHACYDAQFQLKLSAWEGIARGASKQKVYDSARILEAPRHACLSMPRRHPGGAPATSILS